MSETAELAAGLRLHVSEVIGIHIIGMGIEPAHHAIDGRCDQLGIVRLVDIVTPHDFEGFAE